MTTAADRLARAATALVGTPFRLDGRDPATGLDCFGVLHAALLAIGCTPHLPQHYTLRKLTLPDLQPWLTANSLQRTDTPRPGAVGLYRVGPAQPHCAILTSTGFVHAHARLRRVVATPGAPEWPCLCLALPHAD